MLSSLVLYVKSHIIHNYSFKVLWCVLKFISLLLFYRFAILQSSPGGYAKAF